MPVPPVAGEAGHVEAENRADFARAEPGDEVVEAWSGPVPFGLRRIRRRVD